MHEVVGRIGVISVAIVDQQHVAFQAARYEKVEVTVSVVIMWAGGHAVEHGVHAPFLRLFLEPNSTLLFRLVVVKQVGKNQAIPNHMQVQPPVSVHIHPCGLERLQVLTVKAKFSSDVFKLSAAHIAVQLIALWNIHRVSVIGHEQVQQTIAVKVSKCRAKTPPVVLGNSA